MAVNSKHLATFLLGIAAGVAYHKYSSMTEEEKTAMIDKIKSKASDLQTEAESAMEKGKEYFEDLKKKGMAATQEHMGDLDGLLESIFGKSNKKPSEGTKDANA